MNKPIEYLCQIDSGVLPIVDTTWSVEDSSFISWFPQVDTDGIISNVSGGTALNTPYIMGANGLRWLWFVSTGGLLSLVSTSFEFSSTDSVSALIDINDTIWLLVVGLDGQLRVTTETPLENKQYYPSITVVYETDDASNMFELHAIKPNTTMHRR